MVVGPGVGRVDEEAQVTDVLSIEVEPKEGPSGSPSEILSKKSVKVK